MDIGQLCIDVFEKIRIIIIIVLYLYCIVLDSNRKKIIIGGIPPPQEKLIPTPQIAPNTIKYTGMIPLKGLFTRGW